MKRYDIRMDDEDCEQSVTGAWVMWIDAQAALAAKDAELERAKDTLTLVLGWKPGHWFDLTAKFRDEIRASEKGNRRLKKELAAKDAALVECVRVMDDLSELMQEHEFHVGTTSCVPECRICEAYSWMRATIAKHRPEEGADNAAF